VNSSYVKHAGYNEWAEANSILMLYPQTLASLVNPKGCWDWWGYTGSAFASNAGVQLATVRNMVHRVFSVEMK
jgi:poly(3-hydroxybutyrate) depolymerase